MFSISEQNGEKKKVELSFSYYWLDLLFSSWDKQCKYSELNLIQAFWELFQLKKCPYILENFFKSDNNVRILSV